MSIDTFIGSPMFSVPIPAKDVGIPGRTAWEFRDVEVVNSDNEQEEEDDDDNDDDDDDDDLDDFDIEENVGIDEEFVDFDENDFDDDFDDDFEQEIEDDEFDSSEPFELDE